MPFNRRDLLKMFGLAAGGAAAAKVQEVPVETPPAIPHPNGIRMEKTIWQPYGYCPDNGLGAPMKWTHRYICVGCFTELGINEATPPPDVLCRCGKPFPPNHYA